MSFKIENITNNIEAMQFNVKKNSPAIMTLGGIIGLVGTAYLAYRAHGHVKAIVENMEAAQERGEEVSKPAVVGRVALAVAPTVIVGSMSIMSILGSYHVLTNRNSILSSALASVAAENRYIKRRIKEHYPDASLAPVEKKEVETTDEDGNKQLVVGVTPAAVSYLEGFFFNKSMEYVSDDHNYNQTWISTRARMLDNKLQMRGYLTLKEVYDAMAIPMSDIEKKNGSLLGWTSSMLWDLEQDVIRVTDADGYSHPEIYISWPAVTSIYDKADYSSDLSDYYY